MGVMRMKLWERTRERETVKVQVVPAEREKGDTSLFSVTRVLYSTDHDDATFATHTGSDIRRKRSSMFLTGTGVRRQTFHHLLDHHHPALSFDRLLLHLTP